MHAGAAGGGWATDPGAGIAVAALGAAYVLGSRGRQRAGARTLSFAAGWTALAGALLSPLAARAHETLSAHMIQHELLMVVAAPLLVLARPIGAWVRALPRGVRRASALTRLARAASAVARPIPATALHGATIWAWHHPALFQATLSSDVAHAAQHVTLFATAVLFWWSAFRARSAAPLAILALFVTATHTAVLGAVLAFAGTQLYPAYRSATLDDQELAGLIMWVPGGLAYLVGVAFLVRRIVSSAAPFAAEPRAEGA